ncbi:hypothetical protein ACFLT1_06425 [Bacteroidota bacterium]
MKKKKNNFIGKMDERNKEVALKVMAIMYLLTILALQGIVIYRQLALGQDIRDFEDIAIIMTVNTVFLVSALLYFGAIPIQKIKIKSLLLIYALMVVLGSLFTYLKYNVFMDEGLSIKQLFDKLIIVFTIIGLLLLFFLLFYYLGKRKLDKELEE